MRKKLNTLLVFSFLILNVFSMSGFPLYIRTSEGGTITLDVDSADLVENVKQKIQDNVGIAPDRQQLFFAGIELEDVRTLAYYNVQSESSFDLVVIQSMFPEKMSYQAVIRDAANALVANQTVGMRISILQGSASGTAVYVETQTPITNINGLVSLEIGTGTPVTGTFAGIDWATGPYFIKTETDPTGSTSYTITGTSQLMSVPYALYAKTSGSSTPGPQGAQGPAGNDGVNAGPMNILGTTGVSDPNIDVLSPIEGLQWMNSTSGETFVYNGSLWEQVPIPRLNASGTGAYLLDLRGNNTALAYKAANKGTDTNKIPLPGDVELTSIAFSSDNNVNASGGPLIVKIWKNIDSAVTPDNYLPSNLVATVTLISAGEILQSGELRIVSKGDASWVENGISFMPGDGATITQHGNAVGTSNSIVTVFCSTY